MSRKKVVAIDSSRNGSETIEAGLTSVQASGDELERLRDILIGNHVRSSEQSIGELQAQVIALKDAYEARLNDLEARWADDLQKAQESVRQRNEKLDGELSQLRQRLDDEKGVRSHVGKMLVELGQRIQAVGPERD